MTFFGPLRCECCRGHDTVPLAALEPLPAFRHRAAVVTSTLPIRPPLATCSHALFSFSIYYLRMQDRTDDVDDVTSAEESGSEQSEEGNGLSSYCLSHHAIIGFIWPFVLR